MTLPDGLGRSVVAHVRCGDPHRPDVTTWFSACLRAWSDRFGAPVAGVRLHVAVAEPGSWLHEKASPALALFDPGPSMAGREPVDLRLILTEREDAVDLPGYVTTLAYSAVAEVASVAEAGGEIERTQRRTA